MEGLPDDRVNMRSRDLLYGVATLLFVVYIITPQTRRCEEAYNLCLSIYIS